MNLQADQSWAMTGDVVHEETRPEGVPIAEDPIDLLRPEGALGRQVHLEQGGSVHLRYARPAPEDVVILAGHDDAFVEAGEDARVELVHSERRARLGFDEVGAAEVIVVGVGDDAAGHVFDGDVLGEDLAHHGEPERQIALRAGAPRPAVEKERPPILEAPEHQVHVVHVLGEGLDGHAVDARRGSGAEACDTGDPVMQGVAFALRRVLERSLQVGQARLRAHEGDVAALRPQLQQCLFGDEVRSFFRRHPAGQEAAFGSPYEPLHLLSCL